MGLFSRRPLDRKAIEGSDVKSVLSRFDRKKVVEEDLKTFREAILDPAVLSRFRGTESERVFLSMLNASDPALRSWALAILGIIGSDAVKPRVIEVMQDDSSPLIRQSAALALGDLGGADVLEPLIKACASEDVMASLGATGALAKIGDPTGIEAIVEKMCALAEAGQLNVRVNLRGTVFFLLPQYLSQIEKISAPEAWRQMLVLLKRIGYLLPASKDRLKIFSIARSLAEGHEDEFEDVVADYFPNVHRWFLETGDWASAVLR